MPQPILVLLLDMCSPLEFSMFLWLLPACHRAKATWIHYEHHDEFSKMSVKLPDLNPVEQLKDVVEQDPLADKTHELM